MDNVTLANITGTKVAYFTKIKIEEILDPFYVKYQLKYSCSP
jgi:hypothetical protein